MRLVDRLLFWISVTFRPRSAARPILGVVSTTATEETRMTTAVPFKHPPTPPAIQGDFVPVAPKRTFGEAVVDLSADVVDSILSMEWLGDAL